MSSLENTLASIHPKPIFIKRSAKDFTIDDQLANKIADTLNKIKGRIDQELTQSGKLNANEFIKYKVNRKAKEIPNFNIFDQVIEKQGLDIIFLIDCSGSMRGLRDKIRNISGTIFKGLEKCSFINFKVWAFSAKPRDYQSVIDIIDRYQDCNRIQADENDYNEMHNLAIDQAVEVLKKSESKKLIILLTDGYPETYYKGDRVDQTVAENLVSKSVVNAKNNKIPIFTLFYNHIGGRTDRMRDIFRGMMYESKDFEDIKEKLIKELVKAVEKLNQSGA